MLAPRYDEATLRTRGQGRARELPRRLGVPPEALRGSRVLEVGCGNGETTIAVRDLYGADVLGVEPFPRFERTPWASEAVFLKADICEVGGLAPFRFAHSYTVWEHIERPRLALEKLHELLEPGGRAYLVYNLYRGATAAHLAGHLDIPWIHLIHSDDEIRAMMKKKRGLDRGPSWVNKLTWAHYLAYFADIGFRAEKVWYTLRRMDPAFYREHEAKLKAYPIEDLERNFMHVTLVKP